MYLASHVRPFSINASQCTCLIFIVFPFFDLALISLFNPAFTLWKFDFQSNKERQFLNVSFSELYGWCGSCKGRWLLSCLHFHCHFTASCPSPFLPFWVLVIDFCCYWTDWCIGWMLFMLRLHVTEICIKMHGQCWPTCAVSTDKVDEAWVCHGTAINLYRAHTHTHTHTRARARMHARMHACMHTHAHTHLQTSDFRDIFKQDCRKSKPILIGLRSCRWEVWDITSRKGRERKKKQKKKKNREKTNKKENREGLWMAYILRWDWRSFLKA